MITRIQKSIVEIKGKFLLHIVQEFVYLSSVEKLETKMKYIVTLAVLGITHNIACAHATRVRGNK